MRLLGKLENRRSSIRFKRTKSKWQLLLFKILSHIQDGVKFEDERKRLLVRAFVPPDQYPLKLVNSQRQLFQVG
jgi:hypothetical protein